jgi:hypothetical protein
MKSREGKYPPPVELARLIRHWKTVWPSATITQRADEAAVSLHLAEVARGVDAGPDRANGLLLQRRAEHCPKPGGAEGGPEASLQPAANGCCAGADVWLLTRFRDAGSVSRLKLQKRDCRTEAAKSIGTEIEILYRRMREPLSRLGQAGGTAGKAGGSARSQQKQAEDATARLAELESTGRLSAVGSQARGEERAEACARPSQGRSGKATREGCKARCAPSASASCASRRPHPRRMTLRTPSPSCTRMTNRAV